MHFTQVTKVRKAGIYPGFEILGRLHQKSKTWAPVAPLKGLRRSKKVQNVSESSREVQNNYYSFTIFVVNNSFKLREVAYNN